MCYGSSAIPCPDIWKDLQFNCEHGSPKAFTEEESYRINLNYFREQCNLKWDEKIYLVFLNLNFKIYTSKAKAHIYKTLDIILIFKN